MQGPKNRGGRPKREPRPGERVPLGLRVTPEMKQRLDDASLRSGRSQSQEAELRLGQSFERDDLLGDVLTLAYGNQIAGLLMMLGESMLGAGRMARIARFSHDRDSRWLRDDHGWTEDPFAYGQALTAAMQILLSARPPGSPEAPESEHDTPTLDEHTKLMTVGLTEARLMISAVLGKQRDHYVDEGERVRKVLGPFAERLRYPDNETLREHVRELREHSSASSENATLKRGSRQ